MPQFNKLGQKIEGKVGSEEEVTPVVQHLELVPPQQHLAQTKQAAINIQKVAWAGFAAPPYLSQFSELFYNLLLPFTNLSHNLSIAEHMWREFFLLILGELQERAQVRTAGCSQLQILVSPLPTHTLS